SPPAVLISCATPSPRSTPRAAITTLAPACAKSSAAARPIPVPPPVISATFPLKLFILPPGYVCSLFLPDCRQEFRPSARFTHTATRSSDQPSSPVVPESSRPAAPPTPARR